MLNGVKEVLYATPKQLCYALEAEQLKVRVATERLEVIYNSSFGVSMEDLRILAQNTLRELREIEETARANAPK